MHSENDSSEDVRGILDVVSYNFAEQNLHVIVLRNLLLDGGVVKGKRQICPRT
jgi:hypothetical protein